MLQLTLTVQDGGGYGSGSVGGSVETYCDGFENDQRTEEEEVGTPRSARPARWSRHVLVTDAFRSLIEVLGSRWLGPRDIETL